MGGEVAISARERLRRLVAMYHDKKPDGHRRCHQSMPLSLRLPHRSSHCGSPRSSRSPDRPLAVAVVSLSSSRNIPASTTIIERVVQGVEGAERRPHPRVASRPVRIVIGAVRCRQADHLQPIFRGLEPPRSSKKAAGPALARSRPDHQSPPHAVQATENLVARPAGGRRPSPCLPRPIRCPVHSGAGTHPSGLTLAQSFELRSFKLRASELQSFRASQAVFMRVLPLRVRASSVELACACVRVVSSPKPQGGRGGRHHDRERRRRARAGSLASSPRRRKPWRIAGGAGSSVPAYSGTQLTLASLGRQVQSRPRRRERQKTARGARGQERPLELVRSRRSRHRQCSAEVTKGILARPSPARMSSCWPNSFGVSEQPAAWWSARAARPDAGAAGTAADDSRSAEWLRALSSRRPPVGSRRHRRAARAGRGSTSKRLRRVAAEEGPGGPIASTRRRPGRVSHHSRRCTDHALNTLVKSAFHRTSPSIATLTSLNLMSEFTTNVQQYVVARSIDTGGVACLAAVVQQDRRPSCMTAPVHSSTIADSCRFDGTLSLRQQAENSSLHAGRRTGRRIGSSHGPRFPRPASRWSWRTRIDTLPCPLNDRRHRPRAAGRASRCTLSPLRRRGHRRPGRSNLQMTAPIRWHQRPSRASVRHVSKQQAGAAWPARARTQALAADKGSESRPISTCPRHSPFATVASEDQASRALVPESSHQQAFARRLKRPRPRPRALPPSR